ncbi:hypothetical protein QT231_14105 [Halomonas sp. SpR1]|uniref:hypothetical protein n=1 Tax=Halomonas sp. SpR1 TaxID=3050462 RepID=UPI0027E48D0B|nr:hypothetical protein [Halomonas sp. SpR1]MDQ7733842.1 hypothetical protein [Halomonas sp. SpR1]
MATYTLYDKDGNELIHNDLQKKQEWCKDGERLETRFLTLYGEKLGLRLNEEKSRDPTVPDFIHTESGKYVDLKSQTTPFFQSRKYGVDPQYAVTLNKIDVDRYYQLYPGIIVLYHVNWIAVKMVSGYGKTTEVREMEGIWAATINKIKQMCNPENLHAYLQRTNDQQGNARDSYVLDLRHGDFKVIEDDQQKLKQLN